MKHAMKFVFPLLFVIVFVCAASAYAGIEDVRSEVKRVLTSIFGGPVDGSGATTGQAIVKQSDGSWKPGTVSGSPSFPLLAPNGTAGAPSYAFSTEATLGLYREVAGTLGVVGSLDVSGGLSTQSASPSITLLSTGIILLSCDTSVSGGSRISFNGGKDTGATLFLTFEKRSNDGNPPIGLRVSGLAEDQGSTSASPVYFMYMDPTVNYTAASKTGHYEAITANIIETSPPTGTNYLLALRAGAAGTTDKFTVTNAGLVTAISETLTGTLTLTGATVAGTPTWSSSQAITLSTAAQPNITSLGTLTTLASGTHTLNDAANVVVGTTTGTKIGTATTQKLGFFNATPVVQEAGSNDVLASLVTLGLRAASSNPPLNLGSGAITAGNITGTLQTAAQANVTSLGTLTALTTGAITFSGGNSLTSDSTHGLTLVAANGTNSTNTVAITAGNATTSTTAGSITGTAGQSGTGTAGAINFTGGLGGPTSGTGGQFTGAGGAGQGSTSGGGGPATLIGGAGSTASNNNPSGGATISAGLPSGTGAGHVKVQTGYMLASSATAQTAVDRVFVCGKSTTLTNNTGTTFATVTIPASAACTGGTVFYTIKASDGTEFQSAAGTFNWSAENKGGVFVNTISAAINDTQARSSGTLVNTPNISTTGSTVVNIMFNANSSLTVTTLTITWTMILNGPGAVAAV